MIVDSRDPLPAPITYSDAVDLVVEMGETLESARVAARIRSAQSAWAHELTQELVAAFGLLTKIKQLGELGEPELRTDLVAHALLVELYVSLRHVQRLSGRPN
jgi:hypothetical protein